MKKIILILVTLILIVNVTSYGASKKKTVTIIQERKGIKMNIVKK